MRAVIAIALLGLVSGCVGTPPHYDHTIGATEAARINRHTQELVTRYAPPGISSGHLPEEIKYPETKNDSSYYDHPIPWWVP